MIVRTLQGPGMLIADEKQYRVSYQITAVGDSRVSCRTSGKLRIFPSSIAKVYPDECRLRLVSGDEIPVLLNVVRNRVTLQIAGGLP